MKLSNFIRDLYNRSGYGSVKDLAAATGLNNAFIVRALNGQNTMKNLDILFEELTRGVKIETLTESPTIGFKMTNPIDIEYYTERAKRMINRQDIEILTTNEILIRMREFVTNHEKLGNVVKVKYDEPYLTLSVN